MGESIDRKNSEMINSLLEYYDFVFKISLGFTKNPWDSVGLMHEVYLRASKRNTSLRDQQE